MRRKRYLLAILALLIFAELKSQEVWIGAAAGFGMTKPSFDGVKLYHHRTGFAEVKIVKHKTPFFGYYVSATHGQFRLNRKDGDISKELWNWTNSVSELTMGVSLLNPKRRGFAETGLLVGSYWGGTFSRDGETTSVSPKSPHFGIPLNIGIRLGRVSAQYWYIYRISDFRPDNNPISGDKESYSIKSTGVKFLVRLK